METEGYFRVESASVVNYDGNLAGARLSVQWLLSDGVQGNTFPELVSSNGNAEWNEEFSLPASSQKFLTLELLLHWERDTADVVGIKQIDLGRAARTSHKKRHILKYEANAKLQHICIELKLALAIRPSNFNASSSSPSRSNGTLWGNVSDRPALCRCSVGALFFPGDVARNIVSNVIAVTNVVQEPITIAVKCTHPSCIHIEPRNLYVHPAATYYIIATWNGETESKALPATTDKCAKVLVEVSVGGSSIPESFVLNAYRRAPSNALPWHLKQLNDESASPRASHPEMLSPRSMGSNSSLPTSPQGPQYSPPLRLLPVSSVKRFSEPSPATDPFSPHGQWRARANSAGTQPDSGPSPRSARSSQQEAAYHYWVNEVCYTSLAISEQEMLSIRRLLSEMRKVTNLDTGEEEDLEEVVAHLPRYSLSPPPSERQTDWCLRSATKRTKIVLQRLRVLGLYFDTELPGIAKDDIFPTYSIAFNSKFDGCEVNPVQTSQSKISSDGGLAAWPEPVMLTIWTGKQPPEGITLELHLMEHITSFSDVIIGSTTLNLVPYMQRQPVPSEPCSPMTSVISGQGPLLAPRAVSASVLFTINRKYSKLDLLTVPIALLNFFVSVSCPSTELTVSIAPPS